MDTAVTASPNQPPTIIDIGTMKANDTPAKTPFRILSRNGCAGYASPDPASGTG